MRKLKPADVRCPKRGCAGVLFDVSSRLATATGVKHVQCDACRSRWAIKFAGVVDTAAVTPRGK